MSNTPRTECYVLNPHPECVPAEFARDLERENARLKIEQTYFDTLIMSVHHYCGGFVDVCPDDEFGNRMLDWLHEQRKRILDSESALPNV